MIGGYYRREKCRMCESGDLLDVMELTPTPPGNSLLAKEEIEQPETLYPLQLAFCRSCTHVQLRHVVDPRILYQKDYLYVSGTSQQFVRHLEGYANSMVDRFELAPGTLVADIGSNDGTCLRFFKERKMRVVGVDPASKIAQKATDEGIETVASFFSHALAKDLRQRYGPAGFITSHNACAHIDELDDVIRGVEHWLADDGIFVLEVGYFADVFQNLFFDTIYHEHLDYHTVRPFKDLFARTGMELIAAERIAPQGGSIRIIAQKAGGSATPDVSVADLIAHEKWLGLDDPTTVSHFADRIARLGERLRALLRSLKANGKSIAAFGAPTKAVTLLSHFQVGAETLDFVVEDNALKHGLYMPVSHIPVLPTRELYDRLPDYTLILAWNFAAPIIAAHQRYIDSGGHFIVPMPEPEIV